MKINDILRFMAGFFVLASLALSHYVSHKFLWFTAFVGLNLFQSGITGWCSAMWLLKKMGVKEC